MRTCKRCGLDRDAAEFSLHGKYYRKTCKPCYAEMKLADYYAHHAERREQARGRYKARAEEIRAVARAQRRANPERSVLNGIRQRAKRLGLPFNLSEDDIRAPEYCPALGLKLVRMPPSFASPSVDRIIPELGYVKGNVIVVSNLANMIKTCATVDQLKAVAAFYEQLVQ